MSEFLQAAKKLMDDLGASIRPPQTSLPFDFTQMTDTNKLPTYLKIGNLIGKGENNYPALVPLKAIKGIAFELNATNREEVHLAVQHYALQISERSIEGYLALTAIDTKKLGSNFRNLRRLGKNLLTNFVADDEGVKTMLDDHHSKSVSVITECLTHYDSLSDYNEKAGHIQPFRILAIADFPHGFANFDRIEALLQNAQETGLFVFLTYDSTLINSLSKTNQDKFRQVLSHLVCLQEFGNPENDFYRQIGGGIQFGNNYIIQLDRKDISLGNINKQIVQLTPNVVVESDQIDGLRIPIGKVGGQTHYFTLGYESDNFHAIIGGQSGKGKTVLLNNIIARGMETYSSDELRFVIIDCGGTGFQEFDNATSMQLMCRSSNVETCLQAVQFIEQELARREALFNENKVADLKQYIKKTNIPLPRLLCLIDEFHVLYTGKEKYSSYFDNILVDRVIRIGRKFGIHLITCTQSLGGGVRRSILDNIPLRIALGMTTDQSNGFLGMKNDAAANLERGVAIYNPQNGNPASNKVVKVNYITNEDIDRIVLLSQQQNMNSIPFEKILI